MIRQRTMILVVLMLLCLNSPSLAPAADRRPTLPFSNKLESTLDAAKASGKPVVVSFVAVWCPVCARMKREAFRDPVVMALSDEFLWVRVDIDRSLSTARQYGIDAVPEIHLLDSEGQTRAKLVGLLTGPELQEILTRFLDNLKLPPEAEPGELVGPGTDGLRSDLIWSPKGYRGLSICFSHVGYGPLRLDSQSPFQSLRLGIRPRTPSTLADDQWQVRAALTWVNIWALDEAFDSPDNEFFLDYEMLQGTVSAAYGITDTLEIEGEFQNRSRFGGHMDGFIQSFHDLFGIDQNDRDEVPKDLFRFDLTPSDGRPAVSLASGDRGSFVQSLGVSLQHNVTCGTSRLPAFSYAGTVRLSDSDDLGTELDFGLSVAIARRFGPIYVYGTLGYSWFGEDNFRGLELKDTQGTFLAALEWRFMPTQSFLFQLLITEGLIENLDSFSDTSNELTLGWKKQVVPKGVLEVGIIENLVSFDNSPDAGFHVGYSHRF